MRTRLDFELKYHKIKNNNNRTFKKYIYPKGGGNSQTTSEFKMPVNMSRGREPMPGAPLLKLHPVL